MRIAALSVVLLLVLAVLLAAQSPSLTFEVATINPNNSGAAFADIRIQPGGRFAWVNITLKELMRSAYAQQAFENREIRGGPKWIDSDRFDIIAKTEENATIVDPDGLPRPLFAMLRTLLEERFQLRTHNEKAERQGFALVVARPGRLGPKLHVVDVDCVEIIRQQAAGTFRRDPDHAPPCSVGVPPGQVRATAITMDALARVIGTRVGRPVVDRTGLSGNYDVELEFRPEISTGGPVDQPITAPPDLDKPSIFAALEEQLGLRLESAKAIVDVLVIDRAERPTEN